MRVRIGSDRHHLAWAVAHRSKDEIKCPAIQFAVERTEMRCQQPAVKPYCADRLALLAGGPDRL